jgi:hypothetical protein
MKWLFAAWCGVEELTFNAFINQSFDTIYIIGIIIFLFVDTFLRPPSQRFLFE